MKNYLKKNYFWTILFLDLLTFLYLYFTGNTLSSEGILEDKSSDLSDILKPFKDEISKVLNQNQEIKMTKQEPTISFSSNNNKINEVDITPQSTNIVDTNTHVK